MKRSELARWREETSFPVMKLSKLIALSLTVLFAGALTSCNTFLGVGRDLQQAGEGIENTVYKQ